MNEDCPMLRITEIEAGRVGGLRTIKLEGKLLEPWVDELNQSCLSHIEGQTRIQLDLSELTYLDWSGIQAIRDLRRRGVRIAACSNIAAELLQEEL
jgi:anti-anti-sigma regulatory factor